jgi:hypothetical protein
LIKRYDHFAIVERQEIVAVSGHFLLPDFQLTLFVANTILLALSDHPANPSVVYL